MIGCAGERQHPLSARPQLIPPFPFWPSGWCCSSSYQPGSSGCISSHHPLFLSVSSPVTEAQDPGLNLPGGPFLSPGLPSQLPDCGLAWSLKGAASIPSLPRPPSGILPETWCRAACRVRSTTPLPAHVP